MLKIIDTGKNLKWEKVYSSDGTVRKEYCKSILSSACDDIYECVNPNKLSSTEWYKKNDIKHDIFKIEESGYNYVMSNKTVFTVLE